MDITAIAQAANTAQSLSNLILVTPGERVGIQPQADDEFQAPPKKFLFHFEGDQKINLESDITDHYVEDNSAIQDQIALRPETITTTGFIGELNNVTPDFLKPVRFAADRLTTISAYTPQLSEAALLVYNNAFQAYQLAQAIKTTAVQAWSSLDGNIQNKQQRAFNEFYGYWKNRTLFTVQTPWAVLKNMAVQNIQAFQEDGSSVVTEFQITFKAIRFASTLSIGNNLYLEGRASNQGSGLVELGIQTPVQTNLSFLGAIA